MAPHAGDTSDRRIVVLASGRGSNLAALLEAQVAGSLRANVVAVGSDDPAAPALERAEKASVSTFVVAPKRFQNRAAWNDALCTEVSRYQPRVVVLAGFMRIVGSPLLDEFVDRIINVHPSLLPAFPGLDGVAQAIEAGVRVSGCTVHLVDVGVDTGRILGQAAVPVRPSDTAASLHQRIQEQEHRLLPLVVDHFINGDLVSAAERAPDASLSVPPPS